MTQPVVFAYALNGPRAGQRLHGDDIAAALKADELAWAHVDFRKTSAQDWIRTNLSYLDPHRIVSMRRRRVGAAVELEAAVQEDNGPRSAGAFLAALVAALGAKVDPVLQALDEAADAMEEQVVTAPDAALQHPISDIRQRAIGLRRYLAPQRDAVAAILAADVKWIDRLSRRHLTEEHDRLVRQVEDIEAIRERGQVMKDELSSSVADRLNRNTYFLSVIAAVFLPLGFLTGLMGVNLAGIPFADSVWAFGLFAGLLVAVVAVQVVVFRWLRWF